MQNTATSKMAAVLPAAELKLLYAIIMDFCVGDIKLLKTGLMSSAYIGRFQFEFDELHNLTANS